MQYRKNNNKCIDCQRPIDDRAERCVFCANKGKRLGKYHTEETKAKIKITKTGKCRRKHNGNYIDGRSLKKYYCKDCRSLIWWQTAIYGNYRCRTCATKNMILVFGHPTWKKIRYKSIWMRSTWEMIYAKYLDHKGIKWLYEPKTFDLGNTTYTPDFYLHESDTYIEIKGWWRPEAIEKFNLFKKLYSKINIEILDYKKLNKLGIKIKK